jgi:hypothetical protein
MNGCLVSPQSLLQSQTLVLVPALLLPPPFVLVLFQWSAWEPNHHEPNLAWALHSFPSDSCCLCVSSNPCDVKQL